MATDANRGWNWLLWAGFVLSVMAFISYFSFFVEFPSTRNFPWVNLLLFAVAAGFLVVGIRRALIYGLFAFSIFVAGRQMPASAAAPRVGAKAPEFTLTDSDNQPMSLTGLPTEPVRGAAPKGVMLVFYRGYW